MVTTANKAPTMNDPSIPSVPGRKVVGWLAICFSVIPLAMGAKGEGHTYLWTGLALLAAGSMLALIPRKD